MPEQLFLALLGGYFLGVTCERALEWELHGNMVLRWFVGLDLDGVPWDHSIFTQNRKVLGQARDIFPKNFYRRCFAEQ